MKMFQLYIYVNSHFVCIQISSVFKLYAQNCVSSSIWKMICQNKFKDKKFENLVIKIIHSDVLNELIWKIVGCKPYAFILLACLQRR